MYRAESGLFTQRGFDGSSLPLRQVGPSNEQRSSEPPSDPPQPASILRNSRIHYPAASTLSIPVLPSREEPSQLQREAPILARIRSHSLYGSFAEVAAANALLSGRPRPRLD